VGVLVILKRDGLAALPSARVAAGSSVAGAVAARGPDAERTDGVGAEACASAAALLLSGGADVARFGGDYGARDGCQGVNGQLQTTTATDYQKCGTRRPAGLHRALVPSQGGSPRCHC